MASLQKNVASQNFTFCMVNATTGAADTAATVTVRVVKDNGAQAAGGGTVTNSGNGQYNYAPTQAETNATDVGFLLTATSDIPVNIDFHTDLTDANGFTSVNLTDIGGVALATHAAGMVPADVRDWLGTAVTAATAGIPDVNVKNINNISGSGITTVSANMGTTQPLNFTGTGAGAFVQGDAEKARQIKPCPPGKSDWNPCNPRI